MAETGMPSAFFAYPGSPAMGAEAMARAANLISERGYAGTTTWQDLVIEGRLLVKTIQEAIDGVDVLIADVTGLNPNVLFEIGYAISREKLIHLVMDSTQASAVQEFKSFGLLTTVGYHDYGGDSQALADRFGSRMMESNRSAWSDLLPGFRSRPEPRTLFLYPTSLRGDPPRDLDRLLTKRRDMAVLRADEDERGYAPLAWYAELVYRGSASLLYILSPNRTRAVVHNARASLLAGLGVGLEKPTLMLAESPFDPPIDYQDLLYSFGTSRAMQREANRWLDDLPDTLQRLPNRIPAQLGLPNRFGEYVAEYEQDELGDYFVATAEFDSVLEQRTAIFVGRKGTGKTANMLQAAETLNRDRRNLVVVVKPGSYELESLVAVISHLSERDTVDFFLAGLWEFLLHCEIAAAAIREASARPAGIAVGSALDELRAFLDRHDIGLEQDVGSRMDSIVQSLMEKMDQLPRQLDSGRHFLNEYLHATLIRKLRELIGRCLTRRERVALLIDNLDKAWERGANYEILSRIIFGLLTAIGKIDRSFHRGGPDAEPVNVSLGVFLRADIFSQVLRYAREPDKIHMLQIRWDNPDLLARVIEDRYQVYGEAESGSDVWNQIFSDVIDGLPTRQYLLWRCLSRPRDLVYLANSSAMAAVNRRHPRIQEDDIRDAELQYSQFAFEALLVESDPETELGELLFEFAGCQSTLKP